MRATLGLAGTLLLAGCLGLAQSPVGPAAVAPVDFPPFDTTLRIPYAVMGGPMPMGRMAMADAPVPEGATAVTLHVEWMPRTPASAHLMAMVHAGTMERPGAMLAGAGGASPLRTEAAFIPPDGTSLVVMVMPEGEPVGAAVEQEVAVRLEFHALPRPDAPPRTEVDLVVQGTSGPWNASLWDVPGAETSVLLVAGAGQPRLDWEPHALALRDQGIRVVATDGFGPDEREDVLAALRALRALGSPRLAVAGASVGAGGALHAAAAEAGCPTGLAEFSPVPDRRAPTRTPLAFHAYGDRPLLLAVADGDGFSFPEAQQHRAFARGELTYVESPGRAHGTDLLEEASLRTRFAEWLRALPPCA